jgi:hypothetical protein
MDSATGITETVKTDRNGLHVDVSSARLKRAGIQPGEPAIVEVRSYTAGEWMAEAQGRTLSSEEFIAHLERCPEDTGS